jgi:hypothetical protein
VTKWYLPHELPTDVQLMLSGDSISARPVPDLVRDVAAALQAVPRFSPTRASHREPVRTFGADGLRGRFDAELERSAGKRFWMLFGGPHEDLYGTLDVFPDPSLDRAPRTHNIEVSIPIAALDSAGISAFAEWASGLFDALGVFHGFVTTTDMQAQRKTLIREAVARGEMAPPRFDDPMYTILDRMVSDVYWVNYFGPGYVERWGLERLQAIGVRSDVRSTGAVAIWATEMPPMVDSTARRLADYSFKAPFYEALGRRTFTLETLDLPERGEVVPTLDEHRRLSIQH